MPKHLITLPNGASLPDPADLPEGYPFLLHDGTLYGKLSGAFQPLGTYEHFAFDATSDVLTLAAGVHGQASFPLAARQHTGPWIDGDPSVIEIDGLIDAAIDVVAHWGAPDVQTEATLLLERDDNGTIDVLKSQTVDLAAGLRSTQAMRWFGEIRNHRSYRVRALQSAATDLDVVVDIGIAMRR